MKLSLNVARNEHIRAVDIIAEIVRLTKLYEVAEAKLAESKARKPSRKRADALYTDLTKFKEHVISIIKAYENARPRDVDPRLPDRCAADAR